MTTKLTSYVKIVGSKRFNTFYHDGVEVTAERFTDLLLEYMLLYPDYDHRHYNNIAVTDICDIWIFHY